jgi:hypothetical protein
MLSVRTTRPAVKVRSSTTQVADAEGRATLRGARAPGPGLRSCAALVGAGLRAEGRRDPPGVPAEPQHRNGGPNQSQGGDSLISEVKLARTCDAINGRSAKSIIHGSAPLPTPASV